MNVIENDNSSFYNTEINYYLSDIAYIISVICLISKQFFAVFCLTRQSIFTKAAITY